MGGTVNQHQDFHFHRMMLVMESALKKLDDVGGTGHDAECACALCQYVKAIRGLVSCYQPCIDLGLFDVWDVDERLVDGLAIAVEVESKPDGDVQVQRDALDEADDASKP